MKIENVRAKPQSLWFWKNFEEQYTLKMVKHSMYDHPDRMAIKDMDPKLDTSCCLYVYLFPRCKLFGKYRPKDDSPYPEILWCFNGGITLYEEDFDKDGNLIRQEIGCDYQHYWDEDYGQKKIDRVIRDAEELFNEIDILCKQTPEDEKANWWKEKITIPRICASCDSLWECEGKNITKDCMEKAIKEKV